MCIRDSVSVVQRCGLQKGMTLTPQQWEQVQTTELARKAYQYACFLLDRRGYSYQEMFRKLEPKYPQSVCYATVDRLAKVWQINDRADAEQLAHHYVEVKHFGLRRARQEMYRRGLLDEHITEALEPYEDEVTGGILEELVAGKYRKYFLDVYKRQALTRSAWFSVWLPISQPSPTARCITALVSSLMFCPTTKKLACA